MLWANSNTDQDTPKLGSSRTLCQGVQLWLPHEVAKVLQGRYTPHLHIHQGALHHRASLLAETAWIMRTQGAQSRHALCRHRPVQSASGQLCC